MEEKNIRGILVRTDFTYSIINTNDECLLDDMYKYIECESIEIVHLNSRDIMIIDDSGKLNGKDYNLLGTFIFLKCSHPLPGDYIAGNCVFFEKNPPDIVSLTDNKFDGIIEMLELLKYKKIDI